MNTALAKLSLIISFFGLFLLFIVSLFVEVEQTEIDELQNINGRDVRIKGEVIAINNFDKLAIVEVAEIKSVNVIVFDKRLLDFEVGDNITVSGELRDYKGGKEVIAEKIRLME